MFTTASTEPETCTAPAREAAHWLTAPFRAIGLDELNAKAAMLDRRDNKYVVCAGTLRTLLGELACRFDILEIEGKRGFVYDTCYFDDAELRSYFEAHQGRRQRCKVRVRRYVDARLCFVEVKLKDKRGVTVKKRLGYDLRKYGTLDAAARAYVRAAYGDLYQREFDATLNPVIQMRYRRVTLVARQGGERMTIDHGLEFFGPAGERRGIDQQTFILETKSATGNGLADRVLRAAGQRPISHLSKYCVGMAVLKQVPRHNKVLRALRKLKVEPLLDCVA